MLVFDENLTLRDKLMEYDKESLKHYAEYLNLDKISRLKKEELADRIAEHLLDPVVMFYRMSILDDRAVALFERAVGGMVKIEEEEALIAETMNELDIVVLSRGELIVPCDIAAIWEEVKTPEFDLYRKRASWVWKCIRFAEILYVYTPIDNMLDLINIRKGFRMDAEELKGIFDHFPQEMLRILGFDQFFLSLSYASDLEALKVLRSIQADKDFYIPDTREVEELYDTGALLSEEAWQEMRHFLTTGVRFEHAETETLLLELWERIATNKDANETMRWFYDRFRNVDEKRIDKLVKLYMGVSNETRTVANRGFKPSELLVKGDFGQETPRKADVKSRQTNSPAKKIYPNDPCPCGSGKKYKKCCGRKGS